MSFITAIKGFFSLTNIFGSVKKTIRYLIEHWREVAIASLIFTVVYQNFFETEWLSWFGFRTIPGLQQELEVKGKQLKSCELSRERLKGKIEETNEQIDKWADLSRDLQESHDKFAEQLEEMTEQRKKAAKKILEGPTPETCEAAIEYLRNSKKELQWQE